MITWEERMENQLLYLSQADVESLGVTMEEVIRLLEVAFHEKGEGRVEMPPKPGIHPGAGDNFIHAMPAYIPAMNSAGVKWVSGYPENHKRGLPYITGLLILNAPETGLPIAVMDCTWITAMRTAAATAVAARWLARPESSVLGILGCGVQGLTNTEALQVLFPLERVMAYDVRPESVRRFAEEVAARYALDVVPVEAPREAVTGCDLVVTAGPILKMPHATIQAGWLDEGAFASLVDFDSYWHPEALKEADKFCTDDLAQLHHYQEVGYFQAIPPVYADLGELVAGKKSGRESAHERTIACNLGLALDDMAVAPTIYHTAVEQGIGTWLPL
jgi:ornithine cyclodeaminase/alanine dehydrogenase-like protein (mu-crystallin family)